MKKRYCQMDIWLVALTHTHLFFVAVPIGVAFFCIQFSLFSCRCRTIDKSTTSHPQIQWKSTLAVFISIESIILVQFNVNYIYFVYFLLLNLFIVCIKVNFKSMSIPSGCVWSGFSSAFFYYYLLVLLFAFPFDKQQWSLTLWADISCVFGVFFFFSFLKSNLKLPI